MSTKGEPITAMAALSNLSAYRLERERIKAQRIGAIKVIADDAGIAFAENFLEHVRRVAGTDRALLYRVVIALGWADLEPAIAKPLLTKTLAVVAHLVITGTLAANFDPLAPAGQWANPARPPCVWLRATGTHRRMRQTDHQ